MTQSNIRNAQLLGYFKLTGDSDSAVVPGGVGPEPYLRAGSHPDIVERVWDQIGTSLPEDCRCRVGSSPALAHPKTGFVFALAMGTQYALRLPPNLKQAAIQAGAKTTTVWGVKQHFDLAETLGTEWIFGAWLKQELEWCRQVYEAEGAA